MKYIANADITVNAKLVRAGKTFEAKPEDAQGFIVSGQAEQLNEKGQTARETKGIKKGRVK